MPKTRLSLGLAIVFSLLCGLHSPVPALAGEREWVKIRSAHFDLYTPAGERRGRSTILDFERIRSFFISASNATLPPERTTIIAFDSDKDYEPYRWNDFSIAYYQKGYDRDYIVMGQTSGNAQSVAFHEYVHLLVQHSGIEIPLWLNEGLADFYSTLTPAGKKVRLGEVKRNYLNDLRLRSPLPLEELTAVGHDSPYYNEKNRVGVFYEESWALTHMISLSAGYHEGARRFVVELANGASAAEAFQKVYGKTMKQVQVDLRSYIDGSVFMAAVVDVKLEKSAEDLQVTPADDLETQLVLAELLVGRPGNPARQRYEELSRAYPQAASVHAGLAYALIEDDRDAAKQQFAKAVELNSTNGKVYDDYARLLRQDGASNSDVIPLLEKAVQLDANLQETRLHLGFLVMDEQEYGKALAIFARLKNVTREQAVPLYRAQAYAHLRLGNPDQAQQALEIARKYARSPSEIASLDTMDELIRGRETQTQDFASAAFDSQPDEGPPDLARAAASSGAAAELPAAVDPSSTLRISGTLEFFDCQGAKAKMNVKADGKIQSFAITDPGEVVVLGADAATFEFKCGPQSSRRLTIDYEPKEDAEFGTIGEVRIIYLE